MPKRSLTQTSFLLLIPGAGAIPKEDRESSQLAPEPVSLHPASYLRRTCLPCKILFLSCVVEAAGLSGHRAPPGKGDRWVGGSQAPTAGMVFLDLPLKKLLALLDLRCMLYTHRDATEVASTEALLPC